ncbi:alpha/beta-hydrolase family protein [Nocardia amamiensis]|uniref:alpha/beta-hydrolase family protein n=1 Tax=Nocardia amamiensis TaxID=404578 RepID=UPI0008370414|nr:alpha/beta-hydrolase family protein [Nocardia amamiensis]
MTAPFSSATALGGAVRVIPPPRIGTTLGAGIGVLASLAPGLLPRTPGAQAVLTGLLAAITLGIAGTARIILRRVDFDINQRHGWLRLPLLIATSVLVVGAAANAGHWQNRLRAAMGAPRIGTDYWLRCALGAALIIGLFVGATRSIAWALRRLGWARGVSLAAVMAILLYLVGAPAAVGWRDSVYASANAELDPGLVQPVSHTGSAVSWSSLGAEGRKFVSDAPVRAVRVYVGVNSAPDLDSRVALAIRELERSGGFTRSHLVVTVPTGSGWIDANAVAGFDQRFDGDVALVGLQYSYLPSWATFVFGRDAAVTAARSLFAAVENHLEGLAHKPKLYVYGQSLGALGGNAVFADDADQDRRTCAALWAGPPANHVHHGGATVLANTSDPVIHWSLTQLWRAPDLTGARVDAPVPQWLPLISFAQTTADLLAALDAPPGHGHRYGSDQGTAMGGC